MRGMPHHPRPLCRQQRGGLSLLRSSQTILRVDQQYPGVICALLWYTRREKSQQKHVGEEYAHEGCIVEYRRGRAHRSAAMGWASGGTTISRRSASVREAAEYL